MMVVFQNKIIYMPNVPPFSRSEKLEDYKQFHHGITWSTETLTTSDRKRLTIGIAHRPPTVTPTSCASTTQPLTHHLTILFFQGNASSLPPRTPSMSRLLRSFPGHLSITLYALSPRGFWTSTGRAGPRGILVDAVEFMERYSKTSFRNSSSSSSSAPKPAPALDAGNTGPQLSTLLIWGQSIGGPIAISALTALSSSSSNTVSPDGLLLETPFPGVPSVLKSMYPQRWLPYRYLGPLVQRGGWDVRQACTAPSSTWKVGKGGILVLEAGRDEVLGEGMADAVVELIKGKAEGEVKLVTVDGALHSEAVGRGQSDVVKWVEGVVSEREKNMEKVGE